MYTSPKKNICRDQYSQTLTLIDLNLEKNPWGISKPKHNSNNTNKMDIGVSTNADISILERSKFTKNYGFIDANVIEVSLSCNADTNVLQLDINKSSAYNSPMIDDNIYEYNYATKNLFESKKEVITISLTPDNFRNCKENQFIMMFEFYSEMCWTLKAAAKHEMLYIITNINIKHTKINILNRILFVICSDNNCFF